MKVLRTFCSLLCFLLIWQGIARAQWQSLAHSPSQTVYFNNMLLLTDGTVIGQDANAKDWWKLTPDIYGSYVNGTWSQIASMKDARLYFASAVLADGRVVVAGGEYNGGYNVVDQDTAEIYDPVANTWSSLSTPSGWSNIGDAPCAVLSDGRLLLGCPFNNDAAILDPSTLTWSATGAKGDASAEETWTLLPDGTVVTAQCSNYNGSPNAEKFLPSSNSWVSAGTIPVDLVEGASIEIGPGILLPNGTLFAIGATGNTAIYTPPAGNPSGAGTWTAGPTFPVDPTYGQLGAKDAPACLLPNGHVLCAVGPVDGKAGDYLQPTLFFEYDGTNLNQVTSSGNNSNPPYSGCMLMLPTGQVLFSAQQPDVEVYTPTGSPNSSWQPVITNCSTSLTAGQSYTLQGQQLNGLSQACSYGDDVSDATNYPLVRLTFTNTNHVVYCRTYNHSTMAVATGTATVSTNFTVPAGAESGPAHLTVVTNGIASSPLAVTVTNTVQLAAFTLSPTTVVGSKNGSGKVTLSAAAPIGGAVVTLTNTNSAANVPTSVTVPYKATSKSFTITTTAVSTSQSGTVTASYNSGSISKTLTVRPIGVKSVTLSSSSVKGGNSLTGTVTLEANAAPGNISVTFSSSNTKVIPNPAGITISAGSLSGPFTVNTNAVTANTTVTIKATANGITKSVKLTVTP